VVHDAPELRPEALTTLDDPAETGMYAKLVRLAVASLRPTSVLDVGCGAGIPTAAAARAGAQVVVGIDIVRRNLELARATIERAGLNGRVRLHHASWDDVARGRADGGGMELVVANPPYVPEGPGSAVNGGPRGTRLLEAIIAQAPGRTQGLALLFGSISDPLSILDRLDACGFEARELLAESVPFGAYTSQPPTLAVLRHMRERGEAWFCDTEASSDCAPHAYLTLGVIARRSATRTRRNEPLRATLRRVLAHYQARGPGVLRSPGFASILPQW
jgi:hypothetical protein